MTDLLAELRRSTDPADAQLARLLSGLRPPDDAPLPRAGEQLAAFLAAQGSGTTAPLAPDVTPTGDPRLVVVLGQATQPRRRRAVLVALTSGGVWLKVALGAAAAVAAVAVAAGAGPSRDVVVRPADTPSPTPVTGPLVRPDEGEPTPRSQPAPPVERHHLPAERPASTADAQPGTGPVRDSARPARGGTDGRAGAEDDRGRSGRAGGEDDGDDDEGHGTDESGTGDSGSDESGADESGAGPGDGSGSGSDGSTSSDGDNGGD